MKEAFTLFVCFLFALLTGCAGSGSSVSLEGGRVALSDSVYHFGVVDRGVELEHTFFLANAGEGLLRFEVQKPDCACVTVPSPQGEIPIGEKKPIRVRLNTEGLWGTELQRVAVRTNDSLRSVFHLYISADVRSFYTGQ